MEDASDEPTVWEIVRGVLLMAGGSGLVGLLAIQLAGSWSQNPSVSKPAFEEAVQAKAQADMRDIKKQVAADAVREYRMAAASGTKMDRCTQAQLVSAAYLQAQDRVQYAMWKRTELGDCKAAGLPIR